MSALDRKLRRDLWTALGRLLAVSSIIAVGVACYVEMETCYQNLVEARQRYYVQCRMADFTVDLRRVPLADLTLLERVPEVLEIRPRIRFYATVDLDRSQELLNGLVLSLPDRDESVINDIVLRRGSYFTDERPNEVIVNDAFARQHGLHPGQWMHLILNDRRQELFVVGTAISSEFVYLVGPGAIAPDPQRFGVFYLKQRFAEEVFDFDGAANEIAGRLAPSVQANPADVLQRVENILAPYGVFSSTPLRDQASNRYLSEELNGLATFARIMPAIFLGVAALVLNIMMIRWTDQQRTIVGTLKAMGYSGPQVIGHFLKFGLAVGLAGGLAGCLLGFLLAEWVTGVYRQFYEFPVLENRFYWDTSAIGLGISLGCAALGTLQGARKVVRLQPAAAMRPKPPREGGAIWLEHVGFVWRRLGFSWRLVFRDVFRTPWRTFASMFAAAMGTCILVTGFTMQEAMHYLIDIQFRRMQTSDLDLTFKDEQGWEAVDEARRLPGVDYGEPVLDVACTLVHGPYRRKGTVTGLQPGARLTIPRDDQGRPIRVPESGLAMTRKMAELLHVSIGDEVTIVPVRGRRQERPARVMAIVDSYMGLSVYADIYYLNRLIDEEFAASGVQLQLDGTAESHRRLHRELKELAGVQAVSERANAIRNLEETVLQTQNVFIGLLVTFAGVIFFGSVLNASLISLAERQVEVATLRVLGYSPWEVGGIFLRESLLVNSAGTLLGLPLGVRLSRLLADQYDTEMFRIPIVITGSTVVWTLILSAIFALLAHAFVQRSIHKLDWLDALKVRE